MTSDPYGCGFRRTGLIDMASAIAIFCAIVLDGAIWQRIMTGGVAGAGMGIYFLGVRHGESALAVLPGGITLLDDAGPDDAAVGELAGLLPHHANRIDLAVISYPTEENWGGYASLLDHYAIGAFLYNGRNDNAHKTDWQAFIAKIGEKHIPIITVGAGDRIGCGAGCEIDILSPDGDFVRSAESRDTAIVLRVALSSSSSGAGMPVDALFPSDVGANVIERIAASGYDLRADILKAPYPALAAPTSSFTRAFLRAVAPRIIALSPGIKGTLSLPSKTAVAWLASSTDARVIRSGGSGAIGVIPQSGRFLLYND